MADRISDILVVSDMDGTLLTSGMQLLPANLEAIRLFRALGGHFSIATGRTHASVELYPELSELLAPVITSGGGVIYDIATQNVLQYTTLPPTAARQVLKEVQLHFPHVGVMVYGEDLRLYKISSSDNMQKLIEDESMLYFERPSEDLPERWIKILFAASPDVLLELDAYISARSFPGMRFISTGEAYFEVMPEGVSKGNALKELCALMNVSIENTYAIGDYYNDIDLMQSAGYAVAMKNAPSEVQAMADELADSNENAGVGQFLFKLIQRYAPL